MVRKSSKDSLWDNLTEKKDKERESYLRNPEAFPKDRGYQTGGRDDPKVHSNKHSRDKAVYLLSKDMMTGYSPRHTSFCQVPHPDSIY